MRVTVKVVKVSVGTDLLLAYTGIKELVVDNTAEVELAGPGVIVNVTGAQPSVYPIGREFLLEMNPDED